MILSSNKIPPSLHLRKEGLETVYTEEDHGQTEATEKDTDQLYIQLLASTSVRQCISVGFWKLLGIHS